MAASPDRILRLKAVLERTGMSRSTVYRRVEDGSFPRQIQLGPRTTGWRESAIARWIADPSAYAANAMHDGASASGATASPAQ